MKALAIFWAVSSTVLATAAKKPSLSGHTVELGAANEVAFRSVGELEKSTGDDA